jgi:hypothetical protein
MSYIKTDLKELCCKGCGLDSTGSTSEHGNEPSGFIRGEKFLDSFSRRILFYEFR